MYAYVVIATFFGE